MAPASAMLLMPWLVALTALACSGARDGEEPAFARAREEMVATQIAARGVRDAETLAAMRKVPRHLFVPRRCRVEAYDDHPVPDRPRPDDLAAVHRRRS